MDRYIVISLILAIFLVYYTFGAKAGSLMRDLGSTDTRPKLVIQAKTEAKGTALIKVSVNNQRVLHKRNPTSKGATYTIPIDSYMPPQMVAVETTGPNVTISQLVVAGKNLLPLMQFYGSDIVSGSGSLIKDGNFSATGVYGYIYETKI